MFSMLTMPSLTQNMRQRGIYIWMVSERDRLKEFHPSSLQDMFFPPFYIITLLKLNRITLPHPRQDGNACQVIAPLPHPKSKTEGSWLLFFGWHPPPLLRGVGVWHIPIPHQQSDIPWHGTAKWPGVWGINTDTKTQTKPLPQSQPDTLVNVGVGGSGDNTYRLCDILECIYVTLYDNPLPPSLFAISTDHPHSGICPFCPRIWLSGIWTITLFSLNHSPNRWWCDVELHRSACLGVIQILPGPAIPIWHIHQDCE